MGLGNRVVLTGLAGLIIGAGSSIAEAENPKVSAAKSAYQLWLRYARPGSAKALVASKPASPSIPFDAPKRLLTTSVSHPKEPTGIAKGFREIQTEVAKNNALEAFKCAIDKTGNRKLSEGVVRECKEVEEKKPAGAGSRSDPFARTR